jgi:phage baseplate assembly protein gpV
MDRRERMNGSREEMLRSLLDNLQSSMWTALPGIIQSFDNAAMTCVVQPAIMPRVFNFDLQTWVPVKLPLLLDVPVFFPSGGGFTLTFPLKNGDEGLVVFASRCIDAWWQSGGIQPQLELRFQDLSDGFIFPGVKSSPKVIPVISTNNVQLRSDDGAAYVEIDPDRNINALTTAAASVTAPGGITLNGPVTINGTLHVTGEVTGDADGVFSDISVVTHVHTGVSTGGSNTGGPV